MAEKIEQFGCNPTAMDNARERIADDCENDAEWIIGAVVGECRSAAGISLQAPCAGGRETKAAIDFLIDPTAMIYSAGVRFKLAVDSRFNDDSLTFDSRPVQNWEFDLPLGATDRLVLDFVQDNELRVTLLDVETGDELASDTAHFDVDETMDSWSVDQYRQVVASESGGLPFVEFVNFRNPPPSTFHPS